MSDRKNQDNRSTTGNSSSKLQICLLSSDRSQLFQSVNRLLNGDRITDNTAAPKVSTSHHYEIKCFNLVDEFRDFVSSNKEQIDCIVSINNSQSSQVLKELWKSSILLPIVIIETEESIKDFATPKSELDESLEDLVISNPLYHQAEIRLYPTQLQEISSYINLAITKFLSLKPDSDIESDVEKNKSDLVTTAKKSLIFQQRRLTNKIKERLGYLSIYYKRDTNDFYRNLSAENQKEMIQKLTDSYRQILLEYFDENYQINKLIDEFVDRAFFADVSTSQILEIHMDLIDDFSHQLQIEGRNDDILLDYRLPLIDVISHLCEMYRRSIPGEDVSLELLF